jgi:hypothetical protein
MAVKRKISVQRYIVAGVITLLVFALGVLLGLITDYERVQYLENRYAANDLEYRSLQLQYSFLALAADDRSGCPAFEKASENAVEELGKSLDQVEQYQKISASQEDEYLSIARRYTLDNLRYWLLIEEAKQRCPIDKLSVLYFFSLENCPSCPDQGVILTYYKKRFNDQLLVFPINVDLAKDEPMIDVIRSTYGVETYPSIVVEGFTFSGVIPKEELGPLICAGLDIPEEDCA